MTQQHVGKYQLVRKLAAGGMAEVFLAKAAGPMGFEKTLVLKRILPELAEEPAFVQMFLSEAKLAARLTHPNIVQIFDFGESEGAYFLAMEYIDGPSLRTLIKRAAAQGLPLPPTVCARLISQACEGLAFAHDFADPNTGEPLNLIHRDISPDNILLSRQGAVKVVDFGIAKAAGQSHKTESGVIKGKLAYMPPEQIRAKVLDRRADVYALGVVLYELLTGQRPYTSATEAGLMQAILFEPPIPAAQLRPDLPQALRRILSQALAKDRDQRYPDCHALQADLEAFIVSIGKPVMTQQVAQLINRATSNTDLPALSSFPEPTSVARRRPSSSADAVPTPNLREPEISIVVEEPRALVTPPPRRPKPEQTAQMRSSSPFRPPQPSSTSRSSNRWVLPLLGVLLLFAGGGVVGWRRAPEPEMKRPALAVESPPAQTAEPVQPPEPRLLALPDAGEPEAGEPDAGDEGALASPEPMPAKPLGKDTIKGSLDLRVWPYATVYVNGKKLGDTPFKAPLDLPAGHHTLKFVNKKLSKTVRRGIDIQPGQRTDLRVNMVEE